MPIPVGAVDPVRSHLDERAAHQDLRDDLPRDRACRYPGSRLTRRGPAAAAIVAYAILGEIGIIGMPGTEFVADLGIVLRTLIDVLDEKRDRGPRGDRAFGAVIFEEAREDLDRVRLASLRRVARLTGPALVEIDLDVFGPERNPRRAAIDDASDGRPVALAEGRHAEHVSEAVVGHGCPD